MNKSTEDKIRKRIGNYSNPKLVTAYHQQTVECMKFRLLNNGRISPYQKDLEMIIEELDRRHITIPSAK